MPPFGKGHVMDLSLPWPFGPASIAMLCAAAFFYTLSLFRSMPTGVVLLSATIICSFCVSIALLVFGSEPNIREFSVASLSAFLLLVLMVNMSGIYSKLRSAPVEELTSTIAARLLLLFIPLLFVCFAIYKYRQRDCVDKNCRVASYVLGDKNYDIIYYFWAFGLSSVLIWICSMQILELIARIRNLTRIGN